LQLSSAGGEKLRPHSSVSPWRRLCEPPREAFEIQLLDDHGRSLRDGFAAEDTMQLLIGDRAIPRPVIEAAKARAAGEGELRRTRRTTRRPVLTKRGR